jgi:hypothetical protein
MIGLFSLKTFRNLARSVLMYMVYGFTLGYVVCVDNPLALKKMRTICYVLEGSDEETTSVHLFFWRWSGAGQMSFSPLSLP